MRDALKKLEGQLVMVQGTVARGNITQNGTKHFCVANPRVTPWDGESKLIPAKGKPVADHLWVQCTGKSNWPKLYAPHYCIGTVGWYTRANGTVDLSVHDLAKILNADRELFNIRYVLSKGNTKANRLEADRRLSCLATALVEHGTVFDGDVRYVYSHEMSLAEVAERVVTLCRQIDKHDFSDFLPAINRLQSKPKPGSALLLHSPKPAPHKSAVDQLLGRS